MGSLEYWRGRFPNLSDEQLDFWVRRINNNPALAYIYGDPGHGDESDYLDGGVAWRYEPGDYTDDGKTTRGLGQR